MRNTAIFSTVICLATLCMGAPTTAPTTRRAHVNPPLVEAIINRDVATALRLIDTGADVDARDWTGRSPALYYAVATAMRPVVERLVDRGANVNARCIGGFTPLHRACEAGQPALVEYLVSKGANVTATDDFSLTPLHVLSLTRDDDAAAAIAKIVLAKGADANAVDVRLQTPLDQAIQRGRSRTAAVLRAAGGVSGRDVPPARTVDLKRAF